MSLDLIVVVNLLLFFDRLKVKATASKLSLSTWLKWQKPSADLLLIPPNTLDVN